MTLTELLAKVEELDKAANKGPWRYSCEISVPARCAVLSKEELCSEWNHGSRTFTDVVCSVNPSLAHNPPIGSDHNMQFIAQSRTLLPLMAKVIKAQAEALDFCANRKDCSSYEYCGKCGPIYEAEEAQARVDELCSEYAKERV